ncbi:MAG: DUF6029 family protein [bacterium]|nr:DUF6029 family protein [bacterium]
MINFETFMKQVFLVICFLALALTLKSQGNSSDKGNFSGNFQSNTQLYDRDNKIGANTEVYNKYKSSVDAWLMLNYGIKGYNFSLRYDMYNNSPLLNPQGVYNKQGVGFWQASKDIGGLNITAGYFYDQFASGIIFRAFEDRLIGIDFAIQGLRIKYNYKNLAIKAFAGQQKGNIFSGDRFSVSPEAIKGANAQYNFRINEKVAIEIGSSVVNRALDQTTMNAVVAAINSQPLATRFIPKYNTYSANGYGSIGYKDLRLSSEYVYKTREAIKNQNGDLLINKSGTVLFTSLGYSKANLGRKKQFSFGANFQYKRIENYSFRTSPFEILNNGSISYLPSITKQNTYRLLARYNAVTQVLGEEAYQADWLITPRRGTTFAFNISQVKSLAANGDGKGNAKKLFHELYGEVQHKFSKKFKAKIGLQSIFYDQQRYEQKDSTYPTVKTLTPFMELTYKFTKKTSLRVESQYLETGQDLGSFINGIIELNHAPHWSVSVGDMVNVKPHRSSSSTIPSEIIHYYSGFLGYTDGPTVLTIAYIKQVQGVNCTGGICRVEPAFSGVRLTLSSSF